MEETSVTRDRLRWQGRSRDGDVVDEKNVESFGRVDTGFEEQAMPDEFLNLDTWMELIPRREETRVEVLQTSTTGVLCEGQPALGLAGQLLRETEKLTKRTNAKQERMRDVFRPRTAERYSMLLEPEVAPSWLGHKGREATSERLRVSHFTHQGSLSSQP
ncbi:hypothetical protein BT67DRAFT_188074 [Trichocladium antarcticum]|uniref:Uncharacterized protein n=1 Tax=Trichocladium antarcticum TaxID=1450529 RepID=A0AAN6ZFQ5_9PEZI|nr:hypothetical protein BT67DRAFT_188074 [Trichocladium antarcticum]